MIKLLKIGNISKQKDIMTDWHVINIIKILTGNPSSL